MPSPTASSRPALVLGCGNVLAGDDGAGPQTARLLAEGQVLPEGTDVVDGGTLGLDLLPLLDGQDLLVLVDAVDDGRPPGAVTVWRGEAVARTFATPLSIHEVAVADLLGAAMLAGRLPGQVWLVGIQPQTVEPGVGLSEEVAAAVPVAAGVVRKILSGSPVSITC